MGELVVFHSVKGFYVCRIFPGRPLIEIADSKDGGYDAAKAQTEYGIQIPKDYVSRSTGRYWSYYGDLRRMKYKTHPAPRPSSGYKTIKRKQKGSIGIGKMWITPVVKRAKKR